MEWRENLRGAGWMILAMFGFAVEDYFIKRLSADLPVGQILLIMGTAGAIVFGLLAKAQGAPLISSAALSRAVIWRNLGELIAAIGFVTAIALTTLSSASAILQATPLAVTLGAALFLNEPVGWRRWTAILIGFAGVLIIIRPGLDGFEPASLFAVMAVVGLAIRDLATRAVPQNVSSMQLSCYGFATLAPAGAIMLFLSGGATHPSSENWMLLVAALSFGLVGYYAIVGAMRMGDISFVSAFRYTRLIFALALGMLLLGERPDLMTLLGAAVIIASGLFTFFRERALARASATP